MPKQCLVIRFHGCVAFADGFLHRLKISDLNFTPRILYHSSLLEGTRVKGDAGPPHSEHLGKKFLGELESIGVGQISGP